MGDSDGFQKKVCKMISTIKQWLVKSIDRYPRISWPMRSWFNYFFRERELQLMRRIGSVKCGRIVGIDVGANTGVYSYFMSKFSVLVLAFEPNGILTPYWNKINKPNILPLMAAVGNSNEDITLYTPRYENSHVPIHGLSSVISDNVVNSSDTVKEENVPQIQLNELYSLIRVLGSMQLIIKIDVEGYELEVLKGASRIIEEFEPIFIIEIEARHNPQYRQVFELLASNGYSYYYYEHGKLRDCGYEMCGSQKIEDINNYYINNYCFFKMNNELHRDVATRINMT